MRRLIQKRGLILSENGRSALVFFPGQIRLLSSEGESFSISFRKGDEGKTIGFVCKEAIPLQEIAEEKVLTEFPILGETRVDVLGFSDPVVHLGLFGKNGEQEVFLKKVGS